MICPLTLTLSAAMQASLHKHLFPGDGLEAAAILLCSRSSGERLRLLGQHMILVPHEKCEQRQADFLVWPGNYLEQAIDVAEAADLAIILMHSHPGGMFDFSMADDASDKRVIPSLFHACGNLHGTAIMTPDGAIRARIYKPDMECVPVDLVSVAGDNIRYCWSRESSTGKPARPIAFTSAMTAELGSLCAVVVGVSGTGSIVAEQVTRLGFGKVVLIDDDHVEDRNLNRILNSTQTSAETKQAKVEMFAQAIQEIRGPGVAYAVPASVHTREAVLAASQGDVLFCCVDSLEGRYVCDRISQTFLMPLFDVGVAIHTRREGEGYAIAEVSGRIDYVYPGGSTLLDRGVYTPASLEAEYLRRASAEAFNDRVNAGYMKGVVEEAPSVITLNMRAASACVMEYIARAYPFRLDPNHKFARTTFHLAAAEEEYETEFAFTKLANPLLGRGSMEPLLNSPLLKRRSTERE